MIKLLLIALISVSLYATPQRGADFLVWNEELVGYSFDNNLTAVFQNRRDRDIVIKNLSFVYDDGVYYTCVRKGKIVKEFKKTRYELVQTYEGRCEE